MHTQAVDRARRSFPDTGSAPGSSLSHLDPARPPGASGRSGRKLALSSGGTWPPPPRCPELASPTRGVPRRPASSISVSRSSFPVPPPGGPLAPRRPAVARPRPRPAACCLSPAPAVPFGPLRLLAFGGWNVLRVERCFCGFQNVSPVPCGRGAGPCSGQRGRQALWPLDRPRHRAETAPPGPQQSPRASELRSGPVVRGVFYGVRQLTRCACGACVRVYGACRRDRPTGVCFCSA